jgi:hypothetical protein
MTRRHPVIDAEQAQRLRLEPSAPGEDRPQIVGTGQRGRNRDAKQRRQLVLTPFTTAPIRDLAQRIPKRSRHGCDPQLGGWPIESEGFCEVARGYGFGKGAIDGRPRRNLQIL